MNDKKPNVTDIVRMIEEHWVAVTPAYLCKCGHTHHGREIYANGQLLNMALQYGFCDDENCDCTSLRRAG